MEKVLLSYSGRFKWWEYNVSHGQLLIRGPKTNERPTQVDILFKSVTLVNLPTYFDDICIYHSDKFKLSEYRKYTEVSREIYRIRWSDGEGYVIAIAMFHDESDREFHEESPLFSRWPPRIASS